MKDWKKVTGTQKERPKEVDKTSSPFVVYLRRNIMQTERTVEVETGEQHVKEWQYEEREITVSEYDQMMLMQQVVSENTQGIVESVTQFQRDTVIDEYTMQLIEEGLI